MKKNYFITLLLVFCFSVFSFGQVFITELADPNDNANARYIELYNSGGTNVDLNGWRIDKYTNASAAVSQTLTLTGTIAAGGFYIIATGPEDTVIFDTWGVIPDQWDPATNNVAGSNGDDNLELYNSSNVLIDQYGVPGTDGTNQPHEFEDGRAERKPSVTSGNAIWNFDEWNIDNDGGDGDGAIDTDTANGFDPRAWIGTATVPLISATGSIADLSYFERNGPSEEGSFTLSGINLTTDISVSAPTNFEVSLTSGSAFGNSLTISPVSGSVASTTIYIRLVSGLGSNTYNGNVILSSTGADEKTIAVSGEVAPADAQFFFTAFLDPFTYILQNGPSSEQDFVVEGLFLNGDLVITPPQDFEVSLTSGSGFTSSVSITPNSGTIEETTVYMRLKSGLSENTYTGNVTLTSNGVEDKSFEVQGRVFGALTKSLIISGIFDATLSGGTPKGVELYVLNDIEDLSVFGVSSVANGGGTTFPNVEFSFPEVAAKKGDYIYVASEATNFEAFFGFVPNYTTGSVSINGDDSIELYESGQIIDVFGDVNTDGSGEPWEYADGWAYRIANSQPGGTVFTTSEWTYSGADAFDNENVNSTATTPFPIGTFTGTLSVKNNSIDGFTTYPNPITNNRFTITTNSIDVKNITIFNVLGKQIFTTRFLGTKSVVDVSSFSSGLYILKVTEGNKTVTSKLLIK